MTISNVNGLTVTEPTVEELLDATITSPNDGDVLSWEASSSRWVNRAIVAGSNVTISITNTQIIINAGAVTPGNYITEDSSGNYIVEDASGNYITE